MSGRRRDQIDRLVRAARHRLRAGDADAAARLAHDALTASPENQHARIVHAWASIRLGRCDQALHTLDAADWYAAEPASTAPSDRLMPTKLLARAAALARLGRAEDAVRLLHGVLILRPRHRGATFRLVSLLIESGDHAAAIDRLLHFRAAAGCDRRSDLLLAEAFERAGRFDDALALLRPRSDRSLRRIARLCHKAGRYAEALDAYDRLIVPGFDEADTATDAAALAIELGDDERARRYLDAATAADGEHAPALRLLASQHLRCGRFTEAGRLCWRISRRKPDDADAAAGLIVAALCARRYAFADRLMRPFSQRFDADTRRAAMVAAWRAAMSGRILDALRTQTAADASNDVLGALLADARAALTDACNRSTGFADLHYHRAVCLASLDERAEAIAAVDAALALNPGYPAAVELRVRLAIECEAWADAHRVLGAAEGRRVECAQIAELAVVLAAMAESPAAGAEVLRRRCPESAERRQVLDGATRRLRSLGSQDVADRLARRAKARPRLMRTPPRAA